MDALPLRASCCHYYYGSSQSFFNGAGVSSKKMLSCRCRLPHKTRFCSNAVYALSDSSRNKGGGGGQRQQTPPALPYEHRPEHRKPFRFKARWRLALRRLRRLSPSFVLHCFVLYLRTHSKQVALSTLLGCALALGCVGLKFSAADTPLFVPYSALVSHLQAGSVMSVLFEEGSRQVYFDLKPVEGDAEAAQSSELEVVAPASLNVQQGNHVGNVLDAHVKKLKTAIPLDENALKQLRTESSALKAVMDEDIVKHWIGRAEMKVTGPQSLLRGIKNREGDVDVSKEDERSLENRKQSLVLSTADSIVNNDRSSIISSSALEPSSSSLSKATEHASEQLLQTQSHPWKYATRRIDNDEAFLLGLMREKGVIYSSSPQPMSVALRTTLITILSLWIPLTPLFWLMYRQFFGGNSTSQKRRSRSPTAKFDDVAGVDEAKSELIEIVSYLQGAVNFRTLGAKLPKGILLVGPPGTGKTLLARAVAGEAGVPFFATSASEFVEMFVGRGAARIRNLFTTARKQAPSIIFIDELDAVGGRRGRSFNDERDQTLNQLLTEMDGFESETGVLVIAATNRPEALDPALCRPGRFSRKVFVREPDQRGREQILAVHMRDVPIEGEVDFVISVLASITRGFVGADLANVVNEGALLAVREGRPTVTLEDLKTAVMRVKFGVGNKPALYGPLGRVADWLQPKAPKTPPPGYEAPSWSG